MAKLPLEGIRVIDITVVWAGPFATMLLADMGAEVIRVEPVHVFQSSTRGVSPKTPPRRIVEAPGSYYGRRYADKDVSHRPWDRFDMFNRQARNKLSCCMDLRRPQGKEVFRRLVEISDVFIENNSARTMESLGLTYDVLSQWNPRLIYINNPGYGMTGPYKYWMGYGVNVEAVTGHTWLRGYPDEEHPTHVTNIFHMDASGGANGAFAVLMALYKRKKTGKGMYIDMAGGETAIPHLGQAVMDYTMNRRVQRTIGNRDIHGAAPCGCYPCRGGADEWMTITVNNDEEWRGLCRAIGNPPWTREGRFADVLGRWKNQDELDSLIAEWAIRHDKYEAMAMLQRQGVPAGPVINDDDAVHDGQLMARGFFQPLTHRETGAHLYPGVLWKYSRTPLSLRTPPCCLGEYNDYVFKQLLGMSHEQVAALEKDNYAIGGDSWLF